MTNTDRFLRDLNDRANHLFDDPATRYIPNADDQAAYRNWSQNYTVGGDTPENRHTWESLPASTRQSYDPNAGLRDELAALDQRTRAEERLDAEYRAQAQAEHAYWQQKAMAHGLTGDIRCAEAYYNAVELANAPYPDRISENWCVDNMGSSSTSPPAGLDDRGNAGFRLVLIVFGLFLIGGIIALSQAGLI